MDHPEIYRRLTDIFRTVFDDDEMLLDAGTNSEVIDEWDSLAHISLVLAIENEFDIRFIVGEVQALKDVGEMVDLLSRKMDRQVPE